MPPAPDFPLPAPPAAVEPARPLELGIAPEKPAPELLELRVAPPSAAEEPPLLLALKELLAPAEAPPERLAADELDPPARAPPFEV